VLQDPTAKRNFIKQANGIFTFTLKNSSGETESWYLDLKNSGTVGKGEKPADVEVSDVALALSDEDFGKLVEGKQLAQRLFMAGKLKVKGNVMKATKIEGVLKQAREGLGKAKL
jgi:putative sterol carrier protein